MNIGMFIIGGIIFSIYMYFTLWNIFYNMDYDGMGNFSRTPSTEHKLPSGTKSRRGVERTVRVKNKKVHGKIQ